MSVRRKPVALHQAYELFLSLLARLIYPMSFPIWHNLIVPYYLIFLSSLQVSFTNVLCSWPFSHSVSHLNLSKIWMCRAFCNRVELLKERWTVSSRLFRKSAQDPFITPVFNLSSSQSGAFTHCSHSQSIHLRSQPSPRLNLTRVSLNISSALTIKNKRISK